MRPEVRNTASPVCRPGNLHAIEAHPPLRVALPALSSSDHRALQLAKPCPRSPVGGWGAQLRPIGAMLEGSGEGLARRARTSASGTSAMKTPRSLAISSRVAASAALRVWVAAFCSFLSTMAAAMNRSRQTVRGGSGRGQHADFGSALHAGQVTLAQAQSAMSSLLSLGARLRSRVSRPCLHRRSRTNRPLGHLRSIHAKIPKMTVNIPAPITPLMAVGFPCSIDQAAATVSTPQMTVSNFTGCLRFRKRHETPGLAAPRAGRFQVRLRRRERRPAGR